MVVKSKDKRGKRTILVCKNCGKEFSELDVKIWQGKGKFCSNECYKEYRKRNKRVEKEMNCLYQKKEQI